MGQAALSVGCQNMPQLIEKHGLEQKKKKKQASEEKHDPEASLYCFIELDV